MLARNMVLPWCNGWLWLNNPLIFFKLPILMHSKFRLPRQLPTLTLSYSRLPILAHADRELVPALTGVQEEHFNPKCASHPATSSPLSMADKAVLGKTGNGTYHTYIICAIVYSSYVFTKSILWRKTIAKLFQIMINNPWWYFHQSLCGNHGFHYYKL